ncbi:hypothetical protein NLI96_g6493 [Meripilus lineatus]|uniref:SH3 domain-containing protein n=1 Tax=Meripilus lineatus TaxID=2056292 RepID=A0AAD5V0U4_9APHY|nr:hypothetical protein NLI96_g6493 [Physisporinus lineatus]
MSVATLRHRSPGSEHVIRQFLYDRRNVGHSVGVPRADTVGDASSTPVPSTPGSGDKTAVKVLIAFVVILSVAVIGKHPKILVSPGTQLTDSIKTLALLAWRIGVWRRRRLQGGNLARRGSGSSTEKLTASARYRISFPHSGNGHDEKIGDLEAYMLPNPLPAVHSPDKAVRNGTNRFLGSWSFRKSTLSPTSAQQQLLSEPRSQPSSQPQPVPQVTALAYFKSPTSSTQANLGTPGAVPTLQLVGSPNRSRPATPVASLALDVIKEVNPISPVPSPRTASHGPDSPLYKAVGANRPRSKSFNGKKLPRLMTVVYTFVPTLADELSIKLGETIRLIEEYEDEWCLVQRVGKPDAEKGVIPRFCLQERPEVIGTLPRNKKAMSHLHYVQSARP